jgi:hypothetical protein
MKIHSCLLLTVLAAAGAHLEAQAQERVWRCGNEYTNDAAKAQKGNCKVMEGGNITVIQGSRSYASAAPAAARSPAGSPKVDGADQRTRDTEARTVLEAELKKAQDRQTQLQQEYNNGEPEKQGSESKNYQKYLDRVADMKAEIARNESDIAGIQRELARLAPSATAATP